VLFCPFCGQRASILDGRFLFVADGNSENGTTELDRWECHCCGNTFFIGADNG